MTLEKVDMAEFVSDYCRMVEDGVPTAREVAEAFVDRVGMLPGETFDDAVRRTEPQVRYYLG